MPKYQDDLNDWNVEVPLKIGMNYHYKKCHLDEYEEKFGLCNDTMRKYRRDETMRRFGDRLYDKVVEKLLKIGLIEEDTDQANNSLNKDSN